MARILIIDDDPGLRAVLTAVFSDTEHEVQAGEDGPAGLQLASARPPDVVIVDVDMPGMDGYEVCFRLRQQPATAKVPILMLTGMNKLPYAKQGMAAGADDYLTKPFNIHEVAARVEALLKRGAA